MGFAPSFQILILDARWLLCIAVFIAVLRVLN